MKRSMIYSALLAGVVMAGSAYAQQPAQAPGAGVGAGAATGAVGGAIVGGPVGAAVGAVGGAIVGGIAEAMTPKFNTYVVQQNVPSFTYDREVTVGAVLPSSGITYYEVPSEYNSRYRYTVVNKRTVLVDPATNRVVQIIN
ncbi:MAG: DUF1236 domain-containing protein [Beijerinckiaceae bacterium]